MRCPMCHAFLVLLLQYAEALNLESSSGGSDTETLLSRAGVVVDFLDWALPEILHPDIAGERSKRNCLFETRCHDPIIDLLA